MSIDKWNKQFSKHKHTYGKLVNEFIKQHHTLFADASHIACFAEGEGRNAVYLARKGYTVTAFDQSSVGLQNAQSLAAENNTTITTIESDLTKPLQKNEIYDGAIMVFGHVEKEKQAVLLENMINTVKPGGYILFEVYSETQLLYKSGGPENLHFLYNPVTILQLIEPYKVKHFYYGEAERNEGYRHTGACHVIQVIIQK